MLPDKITIYRGPIARLYGHGAELLRRQVRRVVLHEVAHHFGIGDERLMPLEDDCRVAEPSRLSGDIDPIGEDLLR